MQNIADDFEDIRRRMHKLQAPQTQITKTFQECDCTICIEQADVQLGSNKNNGNNTKCSCGHPENRTICDRWDCIAK